MWLGRLKIIHSTSADAWKVTGIWKASKKSSSRLQLHPFVEKNGLSFFYTLLQHSWMKVVFIWCLCLHSLTRLLKQLSTYHDRTIVTTETLKNIIQEEKSECYRKSAIKVTSLELIWIRKNKVKFTSYCRLKQTSN